MKATENEDEYIARMEFERKKRIEDEKHKLLKAAWRVGNHGATP